MLRILLAIFLGTMLLFPKDALAHSQTQIIEMTPNGFVPQEVTIDENSTIIFVNKDKVEHWPASNNHPTHEIYPEFDPRKTIEPGESWAFRPKRIGTFKYHDHIFPHVRGVITAVSEKGEGKLESDVIKPKEKVNVLNKGVVAKVLDALEKFTSNIINTITKPFSFSKKEIKGQLIKVGTFKKLASKNQIKEVEKIAEGYGAKKAWDYIKETFKGESGTSGNVHDLSHLAGGLLYEKEGFEGLALCSSEFAFGCYHGFLDEAFQKDLGHLDEALKACKKLGIGLSGPVASCIHGIGHGVASFYQTTDLKKALSSCRTLQDGNEYCSDGVFMEFVRSAPDSFFKESDPLYPCDMLENEFGYAYSFSCGRNQPSLLMGRFKKPFQETASICMSSNSKPFKSACVEALGFSLASTLDPQKIIEGCSTLGEIEFVNLCKNKAAGELVFQNAPGWEEMTKIICESSLGVREECLEYINRIVSEYGRIRKINFTPRQTNEDLNSYVRRQLGVCYNQGGKDGCYKQVAEVLYSDLGLKKTLELFRKNEAYPEVYARCHEVTHYLSRSEYEKQRDIAKVYLQCDSTCHGGCYHGTLEAYLKQQEAKGGYSINSSFPKVCGDKNTYKTPLIFYECLHGLGHAGMFVTDMNLPQSLKFCDTLSPQEYREKCYTGVFMENSSSSTSFDHKSNYIRENDPFYPCNILDKKYLSLCWQYQSSYFAILVNQDWVKVADLCLKIPEEYQDRCFRTVGTNQVGFTSSLEAMNEDCNLMPTDNFRGICVAGVISSLSYRFVGESQRMFSFCSIVEPDYQESCYRQIGTSLLDWNKDKTFAKKECDKINSPQGRNWCTGSI